MFQNLILCFHGTENYQASRQFCLKTIEKSISNHLQGHLNQHLVIFLEEFIIEKQDVFLELIIKQESANFRNPLKIDNANGWAYYNKGALRHNSNSDGPKYGEAFGAGDIIGVTVDACKGTCSFSKNGKDFGVAYTEAEKFTDGELYAAVTILKAGECVELLMPVPED